MDTKASKRFFFEKKNQKTFVLWGTCWGQALRFWDGKEFWFVDVLG